MTRSVSLEIGRERRPRIPHPRSRRRSGVAPRALAALVGVACAGLWVPAAGAQEFAAVMEEQKAADAEAQASQERIDELDDETETMVARYRQLLSEKASFDAYSEQLAVQVQSQVEEIERTHRELSEIETTTRGVLPMMENMIATLRQFVALDVPFLEGERTRRVATLEALMSRSDVSVSEKYRRIVEAYLVEMEYGRTIEAYEGRLGGDDERTVQFLRVGRVSLLYQTLDARETGYWDAEEKSWVVDDHYRHAFAEGVRVAKKLGAPDIMIAPVRAPQEDRS